jgi:hypothetical protein
MLKEIRQDREYKIFEEIMAKKFPNLKKIINSMDSKPKKHENTKTHHKQSA